MFVDSKMKMHNSCIKFWCLVFVSSVTRWLNLQCICLEMEHVTFVVFHSIKFLPVKLLASLFGFLIWFLLLSPFSFSHSSNPKIAEADDISNLL